MERLAQSIVSINKHGHATIIIIVNRTRSTHTIKQVYKIFIKNRLTDKKSKPAHRP